MLRDARKGALLSMRLVCFNRSNLILRSIAHAMRLEGWAAADF
jgi:hypothetical protein